MSRSWRIAPVMTGVILQDLDDRQGGPGGCLPLPHSVDRRRAAKADEPPMSATYVEILASRCSYRYNETPRSRKVSLSRSGVWA